MQQFAVFGHPIKQSQSPRIHRLFAQQTGIALDYQPRLAPLDRFIPEIRAFFAAGGAGANITTPFKQQAYQLVDELTPRALVAGAVNTIKRLTDGRLLGDNTDGIGLVSDLADVGMLTADSPINVLLLGAGGAARGVIPPLLAQHCRIVIANRTFQRAEEVADVFQSLGPIRAVELAQLIELNFDLAINATTAGLQGEAVPLPSSVIAPQTACYDMFYQLQGLTPFLTWSKKQGAKRLADGLGMLVQQAAHAFHLWHGVMPEVKPVIKALQATASK